MKRALPVKTNWFMICNRFIRECNSRKLSLWHIWKTKKKGSGPNQPPGHRETSRCSQWPVCACLIHPVVRISQELPNTSAVEKYQDSPCWTWATRGSGVAFTVAWHIQVACSELLGKALSSAVTLVALMATLYLLRIIPSINTTFLPACVDWGVAGNVMGFSLDKKLSISCESFLSPLAITALDRWPLGHREMTL